MEKSNSKDQQLLGGEEDRRLETACTMASHPPPNPNIQLERSEGGEGKGARDCSQMLRSKATKNLPYKNGSMPTFSLQTDQESGSTEIR